eukprot:TRINITY_DN7246_c0_g1_i1.p1 TRINITY_DN7246_c0_g1~~TRINITY_DN7246_c0_g1_i1.p1  ORF type:complete len:133 (-),score=24.09 TRINITY_DN7246_c0_g1_i1:53-409(-)
MAAIVSAPIVTVIGHEREVFTCEQEAWNMCENTTGHDDAVIITDAPGTRKHPKRNAKAGHVILYVIKGSLTVSDEEHDNDFDLAVGDKLVLPAHALHSTYTREGCTYIVQTVTESKHV